MRDIMDTGKIPRDHKIWMVPVSDLCAGAPGPLPSSLGIFHFHKKQIRNKEMGFGRGYVHGGEGSLPAIIRTIDP